MEYKKKITKKRNYRILENYSFKITFALLCYATVSIIHFVYLSYVAFWLLQVIKMLFFTEHRGYLCHGNFFFLQFFLHNLSGPRKFFNNFGKISPNFHRIFADFCSFFPGWYSATISLHNIIRCKNSVICVTIVTTISFSWLSLLKTPT